MNRPIQRQPRPVVVIGAGVAGLAAAARLARHGVQVTMIDGRKHLGGRASSYIDPATGDMVDHCQHIVMRCCTNLWHFYQALGVDHHIEFHRRFQFALPGCDRLDVLEADDLPAPLHMTRSLLAFRSLSWADKLSIARGMSAIMRVSRRRRLELDSLSFSEFLAPTRPTPWAIERFWNLVVISACNAPMDHASARYAIQVFQEGFLESSTGYEMGVSRVPLARLYDPVVPMIEQAGGRVILSTMVRSLHWHMPGHDASTNDRPTIAYADLADRQQVCGEFFISALPFDRLAKLIPDDVAMHDRRFGKLSEMRVSPIIGAHMHLQHPDGGPIMPMPHLALLDSPLHWLFNKGMTRDGTQNIHVVISASDELAAMPTDQLRTLIVNELGRFLPRMRDASLVRSHIVKEKRATFLPEPGIDQLRIGLAGNTSNLMTIGDWTDTGWPATMEGACRSGYRAAAVILRRLGLDVPDLPVADLPTDDLYQTLGKLRLAAPPTPTM